MKKIAIIIFSIIGISGCYMIYPLENESRNVFDLDDYTETKYEVSLQFGINSWMTPDENYGKYSDTLDRLKYIFSIPCPELPLVKLNSFTFTRQKDKDTIPTIFYVWGGKGETLLIDSLPVSFDNKIKEKIQSFSIIAESNAPFRDIDSVYINYNIQVGKDTIIKSIFYKRTLRNGSKWLMW